MAAKLTSLALPAYCQELTPIKGRLDQLKDSLCNRVLDALPELEAVLRTELQRFWQDARLARSLAVVLAPGSSKRFFQARYATPLT